MRLLLIALIAWLPGCGMVQTIGAKCGGDLEALCHFVLGDDNQDENDSQLAQLETLTAMLAQQVYQLQVDYANLLSLIGYLDQENEALTQYVDDLADGLAQQQVEINNMVARLAELELQESVSEVLEPCGDSPGFDEVLLRMNSGRLVAYFESGGNRFLSTLPPGNYRTTDGTNCNFSIDNNRRVCDNLGCR